MEKLFTAVLLVLFMSCSASADIPEEYEMRVNSYTVPCEGVMEGECLLIQEGDKIGTEDWQYFYFKDDIEGFIYEPGFIYLIVVRKTPIKNPPQDGSSLRYEFVKLLSKVKDEQ